MGEPRRITGPHHVVDDVWYYRHLDEGFVEFHFGMNLGAFSWMGHIRLRTIYKRSAWLPRFGFWLFHPGWTAQVLWMLADLEASWSPRVRTSASPTTEGEK